VDLEFHNVSGTRESTICGGRKIISNSRKVSNHRREGWKKKGGCQMETLVRENKQRPTSDGQ